MGTGGAADLSTRAALRKPLIGLALGLLAAGLWERVYDFKLDGAAPFRYAPATLPLFGPGQHWERTARS